MTETTIDQRWRLPSLEQWLDAHEVVWTLDPAVPLDQVDMRAGLINQVRHEALDQSTVERYADDITAGDVFPAIVLRRVDERLVPLGGNHRLAGHRAACSTTTAAYVIECDDVTADLAAYQDNRHHGRPTTLAENVSHALRLHLQGGLSIADAARAAGVNRIHLDHRMGADRAGSRAQRLAVAGGTRADRTAGRSEFRKLGIRCRYDLGRITDDVVFARAVTLTLNRTITTHMVTTLASRLNQAGQEMALKILDELVAAEEGRIRNSAGRPPGARNHPAQSLRHQLDQVMRYEPAAITADCSTVEQRSLTRGQIRAAARKLMAIDKALEVFDAREEWT